MTTAITDPADALAPSARERESDPLTLEAYRRELTGFCYRMLGSPFDADDAVQETLLRAWQSYERFEGRSSVRSWLYRIATNACLDMLRAGKRRATPMDLASPARAADDPGQPLAESTWVQPLGTAEALGDPAEQAVQQDSVRLAFIAALQHLPARQRAVLVLRDVLAWSAADVAELLQTSTAAVNSALQRARATIEPLTSDSGLTSASLGDDERALLVRYVNAFQAYDIEALVALLHEDASISMPPYAMWFSGRTDISTFYLGHGSPCRGSHLVPVEVNGQPGFAQYRRDPAGGHAAWSVQVLELSGGRISHIHHFLGPAIFTRLGLPLRVA